MSIENDLKNMMPGAILYIILAMAGISLFGMMSKLENVERENVEQKALR